MQPHRRSSAEREAREILRQRGARTVVRVKDYDLPIINLIAWSESGGVDIIKVVSTRKEEFETTVLFREEIDQLRKSPEAAGSSVNLWVRIGRDGWRMYRVFPGGIINRGGPDVARD